MYEKYMKNRLESTIFKSKCQFKMLRTVQYLSTPSNLIHNLMIYKGNGKFIPVL